MKEEWKVIQECPDYEISNLGRVLSHKKKSNGIISGSFNINGYMELMFRIDKKRHRHYIHRLVAKYFIGESELFVNHIDENKLNNRVDNLEYVTHQENIRKYFSGKFTKSKKILSKSSSKYLGVHRVPSGKFVAQCRIGSERIHLGTFETDIEASKAYQDFLNRRMT